MPQVVKKSSFSRKDNILGTCKFNRSRWKADATMWLTFGVSVNWIVCGVWKHKWVGIIQYTLSYGNKKWSQPSNKEKIPLCTKMKNVLVHKEIVRLTRCATYPDLWQRYQHFERPTSSCQCSGRRRTRISRADNSWKSLRASGPDKHWLQKQFPRQMGQSGSNCLCGVFVPFLGLRRGFSASVQRNGVIIEFRIKRE